MVAVGGCLPETQLALRTPVKAEPHPWTPCPSQLGEGTFQKCPFWFCTDHQKQRSGQARPVLGMLENWSHGTIGLGGRGARSPLQPQPGSGVFCLTGELLVWQGWEGPSHLKEDASSALTMAKFSL